MDDKIIIEESPGVSYEYQTTHHCVLITTDESGSIRDYDDVVNDKEVEVTHKEVHWNTVNGQCEILVFYDRNKKVAVNPGKGKKRVEEALHDE